MNRFSRDWAFLNGDVPYENIVATQCRSIGNELSCLPGQHQRQHSIRQDQSHNLAASRARLTGTLSFARQISATKAFASPRRPCSAMTAQNGPAPNLDVERPAGFRRGQIICCLEYSPLRSLYSLQKKNPFIGEIEGSSASEPTVWRIAGRRVSPLRRHSEDGMRCADFAAYVEYRVAAMPQGQSRRDAAGRHGGPPRKIGRRPSADQSTFKANRRTPASRLPHVRHSRHRP